jgi:hypothetical protein
MSATTTPPTKKTPRRRVAKLRPYRSPAVPPTGSVMAKRTAAVVLEVLSGGRSTTEAGEALGIALNRYYVLEARGIQGLVRALEPRPKGKQKTVEVSLREARAEVRRLQHEVARLQALLRTSQRTLGIKAVRPTGKRSKLETSTGQKKVTRRRRTVRRAAQMIERLRTPSAADAAATSPEASSCRPDAPPQV